MKKSAKIGLGILVLGLAVGFMAHSALKTHTDLVAINKNFSEVCGNQPPEKFESCMSQLVQAQHSCAHAKSEEVCTNETISAFLATNGSP